MIWLIHLHTHLPDHSEYLAFGCLSLGTQQRFCSCFNPRNLQPGELGLFALQRMSVLSPEVSQEWGGLKAAGRSPVDSCSFSDHPPTTSSPPSWPYLAWSTWQRRQRPRTSSSICTARQISPCTSASGSTQLKLIQLSIPGGHRHQHSLSTYHRLGIALSLKIQLTLKRYWVMDLSLAFCYRYCNYPHFQMRKKRHSKEGASKPQS